MRAPSDLGVQAGVEFPFRLRLFTGFGYMPVDWLTDFVADAAPDELSRAFLGLPTYSGTIWRAQLGVRPFRKLGFYIDGGYAYASIHGSFEPSAALAEQLDIQGGYDVDVSLNLWLVEIGHEWIVARHGVLALGVGVMSTFDATTRVSATGGAPRTAEIARGERQATEAFESYGTLPFVGLRFGVDFL